MAKKRTEIDETKYYLVDHVKGEGDEPDHLELLAGPFLSEDEAESNMAPYQIEGHGPIVQHGRDLVGVDLSERKSE